MQRHLSRFTYLLGFQLNSTRERTTCGLVIAATLLLTVYFSNHVASALEQIKTNAANNLTDTTPQQSAVVEPHKNSAAAPGTITGAGYVAKVCWAIPYIPSEGTNSLIQPDSGNRFVILDIAVRNTSSESIDIGKILLTATVLDSQNRQYFSDPLIVAALEMEYPFPNHQIQYKALKSIIAPGVEYRARIFGFEAPKDKAEFTLLLEDGGNDNVQHKAHFSVK